MINEQYFPEASANALKKIQSFFINELLSNPSLEAVIHFGSSLGEHDFDDVDFSVVSDDPNTKKAENWRMTQYGLDNFGNLRWMNIYLLDFFFRIESNLDPATIDSVRLPGPDNHDLEILRQMRHGQIPCTIYTRESVINKYQLAFPRSYVVYIPE